MAVRMQVLKEFEQMHDGIIKKYVKGQEIVGPEAQFMHYKKGDEYLNCTEGVFIPGEGKTQEEIFEEEKQLEAQLYEAAEEQHKAKIELVKKLKVKKPKKE